jgi:hypothetical protein
MGGEQRLVPQERFPNRSVKKELVIMKIAIPAKNADLKAVVKSLDSTWELPRNSDILCFGASADAEFG